jgi:co-chaperonin GroES (HSP10)
MSLRPLGKSFLFEFFATTYGGQFVDRNKGRIILTNQDLSTQATHARWVKVVAVGEKVKDVAVGDIALVEALQWTTELKYEGKSYWKSDETKVIALGADETVTYAY